VQRIPFLYNQCQAPEKVCQHELLEQIWFCWNSPGNWK